jgi:hypothetical protein
MCGQDGEAAGVDPAVLHNDTLLETAKLQPPSPVRVTRELGLEGSRPVTEAELVVSDPISSAISSDTAGSVQVE